MGSRKKSSLFLKWWVYLKRNISFMLNAKTNNALSFITVIVVVIIIPALHGGGIC
jgi:hypothetical protein